MNCSLGRQPIGISAIPLTVSHNLTSGRSFTAASDQLGVPGNLSLPKSPANQSNEALQQCRRDNSRLQLEVQRVSSNLGKRAAELSGCVTTKDDCLTTLRECRTEVAKWLRATKKAEREAQGDIFELFSNRTFLTFE